MTNACRSEAVAPHIEGVEPNGRRWRLAVGLPLAALALAWCAVGPPRILRAQQEARGPVVADDPTALVEGQLKLARRALQLIERSREIGAPVMLPSQETVAWSRRVLEARIYLSLGPGEPKTQDVEVYLGQAKGPAPAGRLAAFEEHFNRMKALDARYRPLYEQGQMSPFDFTKVEFARLQAEVWLIRAKRRPEAGPGRAP